MAIAREIEDITRDLVRHQHDHPPVRDLNREVDRRLKQADRVGDDFARLVGSWTFVLLQAALILAWLAMNVIGLSAHWDPYPFRLLNLVLSLEAALWCSLVLMALNRLAARERVRAQHEYELDVKDEEEVKSLMHHLVAQDEILLQIVGRLDRADRELKRLMRRLETRDAAAAEPEPAPRT
ncbi:MAG TPA: DUF1003 domain-containing protein [Candidatus Acidoferrales bacterium]|nr:DUF1003 domain-containing protein [Candidatus Acidoferrales bacterium]